MLETGIKGSKKIMVTEKNTADVIGSGELPVFATPAMIALMEDTASESVKSFLEEGDSTVGTLVNVRHTSASVRGAEIHCETELVEIDRKRLVFEVKAYDNAGLIGEGTHERFIIHKDRFYEKAAGKLNLE